MNDMVMPIFLAQHITAKEHHAVPLHMPYSTKNPTQNVATGRRMQDLPKLIKRPHLLSFLFIPLPILFKKSWIVTGKKQRSALNDLLQQGILWNIQYCEIYVQFCIFKSQYFNASSVGICHACHFGAKVVADTNVQEAVQGAFVCRCSSQNHSTNV